MDNGQVHLGETQKPGKTLESKTGDIEMVRIS